MPGAIAPCHPISKQVTLGLGKSMFVAGPLVLRAG
jgi:hypothetical protein